MLTSCLCAAGEIFYRNLTSQWVMNERVLPKSVVWLMAISVGAIVANIYYVQPLLAAIAATFHMTVTGAGTIAMLSQVGAACGLVRIAFRWAIAMNAED